MRETKKYKPFQAISLKDRQWPDREVTQAPIWCSVDLRDGNQALASPMSVETKLVMFRMLVECGFKEIEVGFPAASETEFQFVRRLIDDSLIPDDVTIQVLTQAREDLIVRTVESLVGARRAVIHLYNSTSPAQREIVFGLEKPEIIEVAVRGTRWVREHSKRLIGTEVVFQYSPESFSGTEVEFALQVSEAVIVEWDPSPIEKMILNLPCTVEVAMPNVYADQIEWMCRNMSRRDSVIVSVHTHNDRGTGVAATELGLLAGAERVEGTLFGNGERTGNLDIIIVALNPLTQGIDPGLDFSRLDDIRKTYELCTGMTVPPRQPYSGELVFTAFSGSHQDAVKKGLAHREKARGQGGEIPWNIPYLTLDPEDIGRKYEGLIRVNGQSGKAGVAFLLESHGGIQMPKEMQREFGPIACAAIDTLGREVTPDEVWDMFWKEYVERESPFRIESLRIMIGQECQCEAGICIEGRSHRLTGRGNGPVAAFMDALRTAGTCEASVLDYHEHSLGLGESAAAISYICLEFSDGTRRWGAGVDASIANASAKAVISALNRK